MKITPNFATLLSTLAAVISAAAGLGSGGTTAVTYETVTVCGIVAGEPTQRIKCYIDGRTIPIQPNVSYGSISGGRSFFCGLRSGGSTVLCWDTTESTSSFQAKRIYFNKTRPLTDLTVGDDHVCAVTVDSGEPFCWRGVTPDGSPFPSPANSPEFRTVTSGNGFSCGIMKISFRVVCWGNTGNAIGEQIQTQFENFSMLSLVAGENHACGLTVAGKLVCGGKNDSSQLNFPSGSSDSEFSGLALGANFSCAIEQSSGFVTCWGSKANTFTDSVKNISFESVVAGSDFACGLLTVNLSVVCFGPRWENSLNPTVDVELGTILPGPCVKSSCGSCGSFPDSETLCGGSGNICKSCRIQLPVALPLPPAESPAKGHDSQPSKSRNKLYISSLIVGSIGFFFGLCSVIYCCRRIQIEQSTVSDTDDSGPTIAAPPSGSSMRRQRSSTSSIHADKTMLFSFSDLAAATGGFSPENRIGGGSFGVVYRGKLPDGREVAVKRGDAASTKTKKWEEKQSAFESELTLLSRVNHKHLVGLIGFCHESNERLLVFDYMVNGSLHDHLHAQNDVAPINSWTTRIKILLGAARGIEYLHSYAVPPIIHRDIKSSNILLDAHWVARVSDFGLSLVGPDKEHVSNKAVGTVGYIDPEYYVSHVLTAKSDVYGLGVVVLEALTGKRAVFVDDGGPVGVVEYAGPWIAAGQGRRVLDERVGTPETAAVATAVEVVAAVVLRCVEVEGKDRPSVGDVVASLERAVALCEGREDNFSASPSFVSSY